MLLLLQMFLATVPPATWKAAVAECREEDLSVVGRDQIVEDRVYSRTDIEQHVGHHVEVVVEVI